MTSPVIGLVVCGLFGAATAWETWHLVDVAAVVCQTPSGTPAAEASRQYTLGLNLSSDIVMDSPYIISFVRKSSKAVTIKYSISDHYGDEVVPLKSVTLQEVSGTIPSNCKCTSPVLPTNVSSTYGSGYGTQCSDWDNTNCKEWWGEESVGTWCCRKWCYATADCPDSYSSSILSGQYFSYSACNALTSTGTCPWTAVAQTNDPCSCRNSYASFTDDMKSKFSSTYGESCAAWDMQKCAENYASQVDTWCCANWCYVDKACGSALQSLNDNALFWSDLKCPDDSALTAQCPFKPQPAEAADCTCLGETIDASLLPEGADSDYGQQCFAHDADVCEKAYPGATLGMWCCLSWCWVDGKCKTARASTIWPGHFFSTDHCGVDDHEISSCKYDTTTCECIGSPAALTTNYHNLPSGYGSSCSNWDKDGCALRWQNNEHAGWDSSTDNSWCCASWCYINGSCPIAKRSWLSQLASEEVYFSYSTCDDNGPQTYSSGADKCSRRLSAIGDYASEAAAAETQGAAPRMLAGRRRGGGSSRSRTSSPRRRQGPPAPPPSSPRRRGPSPPSASNPRRRQGSTTPRRREVRRRAPSPRRRQPTPRRRAPNPPVPTYVESRRRQTSFSGTNYDSARRRSPDSTADTHRRRRSSPPIQYGYSSRPRVMVVHNNYMPYHAPYGYTGYQSQPAGSNVNLALAGAAGLALGFGSAYLLQSQYNNDYGQHRRRRFNNAIEWCVVQAEGDRYGILQECSACYVLHGPSLCPSAAACATSDGCSYLTPSSYNRDDLETDGFVPKDFTWPLTVSITEISGADINTDPLSGNICPPTTTEEIKFAQDNKKEMSISPEIFLVLTKQDILGDQGNQEESGIISSGMKLLPTVFLVSVLAVLATSLSWFCSP